MSDFGANTETAGGTRFNEGKPGQWWAVPLYGLRLVARVTEYGSEKYAPRDWYEGQSFSTLLDSGFRHYLEALHRGPLARDPDTGERDEEQAYHLAQAAWNLLTLLTFIEEGRAEEVDDVSDWYGVTVREKRAAEEMSNDGYPGAVAEIAQELAKYRRCTGYMRRTREEPAQDPLCRFCNLFQSEHPDRELCSTRRYDVGQSV